MKKGESELQSATVSGPGFQTLVLEATNGWRRTKVSPARTLRHASVLSQDSAPCDSDSVGALHSSPWIPFEPLSVKPAFTLAFSFNTQHLHFALRGQASDQEKGATLHTCVSRWKCLGVSLSPWWLLVIDGWWQEYKNPALLAGVVPLLGTATLQRCHVGQARQGLI